MKTLEQILLDNPPFYASELAGDKGIHWMFMLEDGRLIEQPGKNHATLLGITADEGNPATIEQAFCVQNKALRIAFEAFGELHGRPSITHPRVDAVRQVQGSFPKTYTKFINPNIRLHTGTFFF